ncbi:MAG: hypothetical protein Kow0074_06450 [Candidatus Zixiibacteriota bacterium]
MEALGRAENVSPIDRADIISAFARARRLVGRYERADTAYREALRIIDSSYGPEHPEAAVYHNFLAGLHVNQRQFEDAAREADRALQITRQWTSEDHIEIAAALFYKAVAGTFLEPGKDMAPLFEESIAMYERLLGPTHIRLCRVYGYYSYYCRIRGQTERAVKLGVRAAEISRLNFVAHAGILTDFESLQYLMHVNYAFSAAASPYFDLSAPDAALTAQIADEFLRNSALANIDLFQRRRCLNQVGGEQVVDIYNRLSEISSARGTWRIQTTTLSDEDRRVIDSLEWLRQGLLIELADLTGSCRKNGLEQLPSVSSIAKHLPDSTSLVCYFAYLSVDPTRKYKEYTAYVTAVIEQDGLKLLRPLGDTRAIDSLEMRLSDLMRERAHRQFGPQDAYATEVNAICRAMWAYVWAPISSGISNRHVLIVPDVALATIPFSMLCDPDGRFLIETHTLHNITRIGDIERMTSQREQFTGRLLAIGAPDFDASVDERRFAQMDDAAVPTVQPGFVTRSIPAGCVQFDDLELAPLPGSVREISEIADIWKSGGQHTADVVSGAGASEEFLKSHARDYEVLHIATHGFIIPDSCSGVQNDAGDWETHSAALLNYGLLLAGANHADEDRIAPGAEDGVLTSEEVSLLTLDSTRLVVLSACESGRGVVFRGFGGSIGLCHAFQVAGAATVISSMWPVSDQVTADIMRYIHSADTETYAEALRDYAVQYINAARVEGRYPDPFYWASFVSSGEWRR